jgi:hypothetical protein
MSEHTPGPCFDCGKAVAEVLGSSKGRWVHCPFCGSDGPERPTAAEAVAAWNVLSAAPSLLAACEIAMILLDRVDYDATWILLDYAPSEKAATDRIASAIRAARGGLR